MANEMRHILIPVDLSEHAEYAFRWAANNIFRSGDVIHLATVGDVPMTYSSPDRMPGNERTWTWNEGTDRDGDGS